jgi:glutathione S-transferase
MFIAEKGLTDIEVINLDLQAGDHRTPEFRAKSPLSQIPTLELDDGRTLTESRAICTYLEAIHPDPPLMGRDAYERGAVEMWDRRVELMLSMPIMMWMRHGLPVMARLEKNQNAGVAEANYATAMRMVKWFDAHLADRAFIAGDRLTIADLTALAGLDFAKMAKWRPDETTPHLKRWRDMMADRPAGKVAP